MKQARMGPLAKVMLGGTIAVLAFDVLASVASLRFGFPYGQAAFGSWLIYAVVGFLAGRAGGALRPAALAGAVMGLVDASVGWAVSWFIGPGRPPTGAISAGTWAITAVSVAALGACVGLLGGVVARLAAARRSPAA